MPAHRATYIPGAARTPGRCASASTSTRKVDPSVLFESQSGRVSAMRVSRSRIEGDNIRYPREVTHAVTATDCVRRSAPARGVASLFRGWRPRSCRTARPSRCPTPVSTSKVSRRLLEYLSGGFRFVLVFFVFVQLLHLGFCRRADLASGVHGIKQHWQISLNLDVREPNGAPQAQPATVSSCMLCCGLGILPVGPAAVTTRADRVVPAGAGQSPPPSAERNRVDRPPKTA